MIKKWLEVRRKKQFEAGFGYAATQILLHDELIPTLIYAQGYFDRGMDEALLIIGKLKNTNTKSAPKEEYPEWANWIAQDEISNWHIYEEEPQPSIYFFGWAPGESRMLAIKAEDSSVDWWNTKRKL